jgi:nucleoside-diphosphate-sugar epimerase
MEAELQQAAAAGPVQATVIRAGDFYGCGSGSWLDQAIVKDIAKGKLVYPGPLDLPHAWAYLPDLAAAFAAVAAQPPRPRAQAFQSLHFSGHTLTGRELMQGLEQAATSLGLRPAGGFRVGGMPWGLMRVLGLAMPMLRELVRMRYLWTRPHALAGEQLARAAGPLPHTPVDVALQQALRDLGLGSQPAGEAPAAAVGAAKALSSRRAPA